MKNSNNKLSILAMLIVTIGILAGFFGVYNNQKPVLDATAAAYQEGRAVSLDREVPEHTMATMLEDRGYYTDPCDARCVAHHVSTTLKKEKYSIRRLGELNLWDYQIPAITAKRSGGVVLKVLPLKWQFSILEVPLARPAIPPMPACWAAVEIERPLTGQTKSPSIVQPIIRPPWFLPTKPP